MPARCAVVTGASGTLGTALVRLLADQGLDVLAVSRSGRAPGSGEWASLAADLGEDASIEQIRSAMPPGELAMAVHALGLPKAPGVTTVDPGLLGVAANLKAGGFLRLIRALDKRTGHGSRLVAVGGHLGIEPTEHTPLPGVGNAALANLVRQMVAPVGRVGATVHLVAPGPFQSPRIDALLAARAENEGVSLEAARADMLAEYPTGTIPTADDIAHNIVALLSPSATAMHGATLFMDGGARRAIF